MILIKDVKPELHDVWAAQWEAMGPELREKIAVEIFGNHEHDDMTPFDEKQRVEFASNRARRIISRWASTLLLPAKVACVNACFLIENELHPKYAAAFEPFIGTSILKADGTFRKNVLAALPPDRPHSRQPGDTVHLYHYVSAGMYSITVTIRADTMTAANDPVSHTTTLYLGTTQAGTLTSLYPVKSRLLVDEATLRATAAAYKDAKAAAEKLKEQLVPFTDEDLRFA